MNENADIDALLKKTLDTLGVPVARVFFGGKAESFVTFQYLGGREDSHADDEAVSYEHAYRADIFSRSDYTGLLRQMKAALKPAGFYGIAVLAELYENDTGFYHIPTEFYYMEV
jgi:hypothetical protein